MRKVLLKPTSTSYLFICWNLVQPSSLEILGLVQSSYSESLRNSCLPTRNSLSISRPTKVSPNCQFMGCLKSHSRFLLGGIWSWYIHQDPSFRWCFLSFLWCSRMRTSKWSPWRSSWCPRSTSLRKKPHEARRTCGTVETLFPLSYSKNLGTRFL